MTSRGLLAWVEHDPSLAVARDAITAPAISVEPGASVRDAVALMAREQVGHLLVAHRAGAMPEGVLSELDVLRV